MTEVYRSIEKDEVVLEGNDGGQLVRVVGLSFRSAYPNNILALEAGEGDPPIELTLRREPQNPYDANAVMVCVKQTGEHLGYISKELNEPYAEAMDAGEEFFACVDEVRISGKNPRQPGLIIYTRRANTRPALEAPKKGG